MTFEELKAILEKQDKGSEMIESITTLINDEKSKGIAAHQKVNRESQALRKYKKALEALGADEDTDLDAFTSELLEKKNAKPDEDNKLTLKTLQNQLATMQKALEDEKGKAKRSVLSEKLTQALGDKVYGSQYVIKSLIDDGMVSLVEGKVQFKINDQQLEFNDGIKAFLDSNKDIVKSTQTPGAGSIKTDAGIPTNINEIMNSGDRSKIAANIQEIAKATGLKI